MKPGMLPALLTSLSLLCPYPAAARQTSKPSRTHTLTAAVKPTVASRREWLSDLLPASVSQGWGQFGVNRSVQGKRLTVVGRSFDQGLGTHANSEIVYDLAGEYDRFEAWVGMDDEMNSFAKGSIVFKVLVDGAEVYRSPVMRTGTPVEHVDVAVKNGQDLRLIAQAAGPMIDGDHADWCGAALYGRRIVSAPAKPVAEVRSGAMRLALGANGEVVGLAVGRGLPMRPVRALTRVGGLKTTGAVRIRKLHGGIEFRRNAASPRGERCEITDRYTPCADGVRWDVEIRSGLPAWSAPITTLLTWPEPASARFWTAWQDPVETDPSEWHDPLVPQPFRTAAWSYGRPSSGAPWTAGSITSLPMVSILTPEKDTGISLIESPDDLFLDLDIDTTRNGQVAFRRSKFRLGDNKTVRFTMLLVSHAADWRGGLGRMAEHFPKYFNPVNPDVQQMAGTAAYTGEEKPVEVERLRRMGFKTCWKLSDDYVYMGLFLPPLTDNDDRWDRTRDSGDPPDYKPIWRTFRRMNDYAKWLRANGFYLLSYFNTTEYGRDVDRKRLTEPQPVAATITDDLWKDPTGYLLSRMPNAPYKPISDAWQGGVVVDPGDPGYRDYLLEQAQRHVDKIPDASGICIDRTDYLVLYNSGGNDGVSWVDGKPARALTRSWHALLDRLGPLMHRNRKVIFSNFMHPRLDLARQIDGLYDEFGDVPTVLNGSSFLCIRKPFLAWTRNENTLDDAFFQRQLYLGAFPTAPYPLNNHCIQPAPDRDPWYYDYGPLFDRLHGKRWVLTPHCIEVEKAAKANLFEVPGGWAMPVTFGPKEGSARIVLRHLKGLRPGTKCEVLHPGESRARSIKVENRGGVMTLTVPLHRGCAMVWIVR